MKPHLDPIEQESLVEDSEIVSYNLLRKQNAPTFLPDFSSLLLVV
jgi:hypothetical protein